MSKSIAVIAVGVVLVGAIAWAQIANSNYQMQGGQRWVVGGQMDFPAQDVTVTTATTTFSAANKTAVSLTTNANVTGVYPTGGVVGQWLVIQSGAGSNTIRFDDNASTLSLGANITITEGQQDVLGLLCTGVDEVSGNNTWTAIFAHDN